MAQLRSLGRVMRAEVDACREKAGPRSPWLHYCGAALQLDATQQWNRYTSNEWVVVHLGRNPYNLEPANISWRERAPIGRASAKSMHDCWDWLEQLERSGGIAPRWYKHEELCAITMMLPDSFPEDFGVNFSQIQGLGEVCRVPAWRMRRRNAGIIRCQAAQG